MHGQSQDRDVVEPVPQLADDLAGPESSEVAVPLQEIPIAQSAHVGRYYIARSTCYDGKRCASGDAAEEIMQSIEEQVVACLKEAPAHLMSFRQLVRDLDFESDERHEIRHVLHAMVKEGTLI